MIKVSVIIPVYNVEPYIKRCLDSVINQTLKDIEVICINDCSTDNSLNILKEYATKDCRIKLIDLPKNQGAAVARNKGLEIAQGEYLGFVDPDDEIDLNFYEELYKKASPNNTDIVKSEFITIQEDGTQTKNVLNKLIKNNNIYYFTYEWQSAIYKASLIYDNNIIFPPEVRKAQDVVFLNRVVLKAKSFELIDNVNYYYYKREGSLNANKIPIDRIKSALLATEYILQNINNEYENQTFREDEYINMYYRRLQTIICYTFYKNDTIEAKTLIVEKYIEMFKKCKNTQELKKLFPPICKDYLELIENDDTKSLIEFHTNYKSYKEYFLSKLRKNVKKDMNKNSYKEVV